MGEGKITLKENQEEKDFTPTEDIKLDSLPYRLSIFVTLLKNKREIKAEKFVELLNKNGVFIDVNIDNNGTRELRYMKEALIDLGYPIGSHNSKGYFFINHRIDEDRACSEYISKAKTMLIRANKIKKNVQNYYKRTPDQMTLFSIEERRAR